MLNSNELRTFTVGINDDVTNLSLPVDETYKISGANEFLIYGFGSDGMVSASKSIMKIIGDNTNHYVQGYFQYDSKKSGGVTVGHLRFKDAPIRSTYYVENPKIVVVTKDTYLDEFKILNNIQANGIFILNTIQTKEDIIKSLTDDVKSAILSKHLKFYIINAYELARKVGLKNKISTIMVSAIFSLTDILP
jgi:pyruvate-ferredoxin/flavodoxin oxidoreductase